MLARRELPEHFRDWNARWQAPFGPDWAEELPFEKKSQPAVARSIGRFAFQGNNSTREVEYPWAFFEAAVRPGTDVVEVGGGLSGFQFVLANEGANVTNVDPFVDFGTAYEDAPEERHAGLNAVFGTSVRLVRSPLAAAHLPDESFDRALCISTIEHLDDDQIVAMLGEIRRVLRPGGLFVLTVDLFLDLAPFTEDERNRWGRNVSVAWLVEESRLDLAVGDRAELLGFPEFDPDRIRDQLDRYHVGAGYPTLAQLLVLEQPL